MKKSMLTILLLALLFGGCNNESAGPDACSCAKEIHDNSNKAEHYDRCLDLIRADAKFSIDYAKCSAALALNKTDTTGLTMEASQLPQASDGAYQMVAGRDSIVWRGQKITGDAHSGMIKAKSGTIKTEGGKITGGEIILDMNSISINEMDDNAKGKEKLGNHLRSDDFFSVATHPEAKFVITSVEQAGDNSLMKGNLTLKGKTNEAIGSVKISGTGESNVIVSGVIQFDRSLFDVRYGSGKFFENLGDDMIVDQVTLTYSFIAAK
ncbi:MAG: YceI family protein [Flavobacteriales bacterium]|mgnify:CR=1 FL=1|nr:YceI family protein [Flavobacteriales bacterium]